MLISNNASAKILLGTLNRNLNRVSKTSSQLALGEKIRNAGDDASGYAISERMRVRIRSLDQADANVQNGASMLKIAEGAIQSQINLLRTVKAKVIDAHNDTNTDDDRRIIQKEITQYYNEINDIAAETTFNGKQLLMGTKVVDAVKSWYKLDHAEAIEGTDALGLIPGSVATFGSPDDDVPWDGYNIKTLSTENMTGGTADSKREIALVIPASASATTVENKAFKVVHPGGEDIFVFAFGSKRYYGNNIHQINLSSQRNLELVISETLMPILRDTLKVDYVSTLDGTKKIILQTKIGGDETDDSNTYDIKGVSVTGGTIGGVRYDSASSIPESYITHYESHGANGATAAVTKDLSSYNSTDMSKVEDLIAEYVGKAIYHSGNGVTYEFVDKGNTLSTDSLSKLNGSTVLDLNQIRSAVNSGKTAAEAFVDLLSAKIFSSDGTSLVEAVKNGSNQVTGFKIKATGRGTAGNSQTISIKQGDLRDYTIDFKSYFNSKGIADEDIAVKLNDKGFRVYDVQNPNKWVNVLFVNGINPEDGERPASGGNGMDIDTLVVDLSDVTSFQSFMDTLYKGDGDKNPVGLSQLLEETSDHFHLAMDYDKGTMTIYDDRRYYVLNGTTDRGAKIADGIVDNVVCDYRNTYVNEMVIQHTDRSSANVHIRIPQTTMDHIFGYKVGESSLDDYNVLTSANREYLLGQDYPIKSTGVLDRGLQYLIDANTLIGAQINHMENADANIITELENTTAAESTIRDADIAKSALDHATANILSQSTMAMLSQFNQSSYDVLGLLQ